MIEELIKRAEEMEIDAFSRIQLFLVEELQSLSKSGVFLNVKSY
jgi:hypothetical protein